MPPAPSRRSMPVAAGDLGRGGSLARPAGAAAAAVALVALPGPLSVVVGSSVGVVSVGVVVVSAAVGVVSVGVGLRRRSSASVSVSVGCRLRGRVWSVVLHCSRDQLEQVVEARRARASRTSRIHARGQRVEDLLRRWCSSVVRRRGSALAARRSGARPAVEPVLERGRAAAPGSGCPRRRRSPRPAAAPRSASASSGCGARSLTGRCRAARPATARQAGLLDRLGGLVDRVLHAPPLGRPALGVQQEPRGARVAVARLAHPAGVEQPLALGQVLLHAGRRRARRRRLPSPLR